jgi:phosphonate transport system substrate-binding protein
MQKFYLIFKNLIILSLFFGTLTVANEKTTINFAPLPMKKASKNIQEFVPINIYLKEKLQIETSYIYKKNYKDILNSFINGEIDIAYLGPLPLVSLMQQYPHIKPIITFKQKNGSLKYRCVLAKFKKDKFDPKSNFNVSLTQPLSTCGYYMSKKLLHQKFNINLDQKKYNYNMSHRDALLAVLEGNYLIAGASDSIAKSYNSVGMQIIAQSEELPGFSLVANTKTLSKGQIDKIQKTLLSIPKDIYSSWKGVTSRGFVEANIDDYKTIDVDFTTIPLKGNM